MKNGMMSAYDAEGLRKYLTKAEGRKFLQCASKLTRQRSLFCLTIYYTGCRISEALNLVGNDIDSQQLLIRVRSLKKRKKKMVRRIPVPASLARSLTRVVTHDSEQPLWDFSRTTAWRIVKSVMADARIVGIQATAKGLRHGFGVRGAMEGIPINVIQNWLGHADLETTAIYLEVRDEEDRQLIKRTWK